MQRIVHVVGARPNFMKVAPIIRAMAAFPDEFEQYLVHTGQHYDANLQREGIPSERICFVGNVMIDSLTRLLPKAQERWPALRSRIGSGQFVLVTLHRPSNVDQPETLHELLMALDDLSGEISVVFP